jgi:hypothetical protein
MEFNLGDKVLVRRSWIKDSPWIPAFFGYELKTPINEAIYVIFGGGHYDQCLPLEGNEGLAGSVPQEEMELHPRKKFEFLEEVEVDVLGDDDWEKAWYVECVELSENDDAPHKVLLDEDKETYYVEDCCIRSKNQQK